MTCHNSYHAKGEKRAKPKDDTIAPGCAQWRSDGHVESVSGDSKVTHFVFDFMLMQLDDFLKSKEDKSSSYKLLQARPKGSPAFLAPLEERNVLPCEGKRFRHA